MLAQVRTARSSFLQFSPPAITEAEIDAVVKTLRSGWITTGPKTKEFEAEFRDYLGVNSALALNSCTSGLHVALVALGIGAGDEVITTAMTFCSTANVIEHTGATTVLADVEPDILTISPDKVAAAITPRTKAIVVVHYAGHPVDMDPIMELAREHNLYVIEDCAHSLPAFYKGKMAGTFGDFAAFSFYATKNLTTGEGGMLVGTSDKMDWARIVSLHGMSRDAWNRYNAEGSWYYEVATPGFKYNMTDIQAAIGSVQLERLDEMQQRRLEIVERYYAGLSAIDAIELPTERPESQSAWHLFAIRLRLEELLINRAQFIDELKARNIGTSVHFIPIHHHPYYRNKYGWVPESFPVANAEYKRLVSLPLHPGLTDDDVDDVINAVRDVIQGYRC